MACLICVGIVIILLFAVRRILEGIKLDRLRSRNVFVTGCDSGFGRLIALKLARNSIPTIAACFTEKGQDDLRKEVQSFGCKIETVLLNVTDEKSVDSAYEQVKEKLDGEGLWALVNNAGALGTNGPDEWLSVADYKSIMDVNFYGVVRVCQKFKDLVKKRRGRVITVASILGRVPGKYVGPYTAAKHACEGYMDVLRQELRSFGVTVHIVEPGFFNTGLTDKQAVQETNKKLWNRCSQEVKDEFGEHFFDQFCCAADRLLGRLCSDQPSMVSDAYFHAITARYPRHRYHVGYDAMFLWIPMAMMPTCMQDWAFRVLELIQGSPKPLSAKAK